MVKRASAARGSHDLRILLVFVAATAPVGSARAVVDPLASPKSQVRLVSAGSLKDGSYHVGVDVQLAPGVLTYWSFPGEAGVPPSFEFSGSRNVAHASVAYPAPRRIVEDGATAFGWRQEVVFPVDVSPRDPSLPTRLDLTIRYATCDTICVPAEAKDTILLTPRGVASLDAAKLALWRARVPIAPPVDMTPHVQRMSGGPDPTWSVTFGPSSAPDDLFVVGDDGWYFDSKASGSGVFTITQQQKPADSRPGATPVVLTYVAGEHAYRVPLDLDAASRRR